MKAVIIYDRHMPEELELCFSSLGVGAGVKNILVAKRREMAVSCKS